MMIARFSEPAKAIASKCGRVESALSSLVLPLACVLCVKPSLAQSGASPTVERGRGVQMSAGKAGVSPALCSHLLTLS
jgi:hypothetical protein